MIFVFILFGIIMRLIAASLGYTYDMESYTLVGKIITTGGNVYAETSRYNYGPVWMYVIGALYKLSFLFDHPFLIFRFSIALLLSFVDVGIFIILLRQFSLVAGLLYYLNPLAILLTGYNSQFDNLAVLVALVAMLMYKKRKISGLVVLGVSLAIKHIFFAFPLWLALREKHWVWRFLVLLIPLGVFILGFVPYMKEGMAGIINNVFLYVSFNNAPLWHFFILNGLPRILNQYILFGGALLVGAFAFRKRSLIESLLFYTMILVVFSVSVADQYFSIVLPFIAVFPNMFFFLFALLQILYTWIVVSGGEVYASWLGRALDRSAIGYDWQLVLLFVGLVWAVSRKRMRRWNPKHWIAFLILLNALFVFGIVLPDHRENEKVAAIEQAIRRGDYEEANVLYTRIEQEAPLAGSRFWHKLGRSRYYVEYYRRFTKAQDLYGDGLASFERKEIELLLVHMPPDYRYAEEVRDMLKSVHN